MNVLITGGARGLGKEMGEYLFKRGLNIIIVDLKPENLLDSELRRKLFKYYRFDLNNYKDIKSLTEKITNECGNIDVLINNASLRSFKHFTEFNESEIINYVNVNLTSLYLITLHILKNMLKNNFGRIINISSVSAYKGYSTGSLYCSMKSSLLTFNESVSRELNVIEKNVTLNTICPDSFMKISGEKLKYYGKTANKIKTIAFNIINTKVNGEIYNVLSNKSKIRYFKIYLNKAFSFLK